MNVEMPALRVQLYEYVKRWAKIVTQSKFRYKYFELRRLRRFPRYSLTHTNLLGPQLEIVDAFTFLGMYDSILQKEIYRFSCSSNQPYIIDGGANIGISVLYFKQLFPDAYITAFEPDPDVFCALRHNCETHNLKNVELVSKALWTQDTVLNFQQEGSDSGRITSSEEAGLQPVPACRLKDYLHRKVDFLKLDIEGAETNVLADCADVLNNVENLFVEYHSFKGKPQSLFELLRFLSEAGFRVHVHSYIPAPQPFMKRDGYRDMDLLLNIFAFRETTVPELD